MLIKIKPIQNWTSNDFVGYFKREYDRRYDLDMQIEHVKDCTIMKRIVSKFRKHDKPKTTVLKFIDWVFEEYSSRKEFTTPLTIGFLAYWVDEFLQLKTEDRKKKKAKPVELSKETVTWLEEQKQEYNKEDQNV